MKNQKAHDYTNYISVHDLLYPEYLQVSAPPQEYDDNHVTPTMVVAIDEPESNVNRWDVVWAEATLLNGANTQPMGHNENVDSTVQQSGNSNSHTVSAVPELISSAQTTSAGGINVHAASNTVTASNTSKYNTTDAPFYHGNIIEDIFGLSFAIAAVAGTLAFEISTMVVYVIATVLFEAAKKFQRNRSLLLGFALHICALVFILVAYTLLLVDAALFIGSIILAESWAISAGIVNALFSCGQRGMIWHQYIRKICHLSRWAFREIYPSTEKEPKRTLPSCQKKVTKEPRPPRPNDTNT
jgi:hypothetical protein